MELNQLRRGESELVHHPVSLCAPAGAAGGLPETRASDAVGPDAVPVLPATQAEEVAVLVS